MMEVICILTMLLVIFLAWTSYVLEIRVRDMWMSLASRSDELKDALDQLNERLEGIEEKLED